MNRKNIADLIVANLQSNFDKLLTSYEQSISKIGYFFIDDLLPTSLAKEIYESFPDVKDMQLKKSIREYKYIAAQMDQYHPLLEEIIYAFQDSRVLKIISDVCNIKDLQPDHNLYAGGISQMVSDHFLSPHIDNSHDNNREKWRVLNLLYYVTPNWDLNNGGNLELWPQGIKEKQLTIHSKFNRLIVMATHNTSLHSVSKISNIENSRCCVSNYYFSNNPLKEVDSFHVTSFRAWPDQKAKDLLLRTDSKARMFIRKIFKKGVVENKHIYKK